MILFLYDSSLVLYFSFFNRDMTREWCMVGQAYTNELENKVSRLEEENERLRRQKVYLYLCVCIIYMDTFTPKK